MARRLSSLVDVNRFDEQGKLDSLLLVTNDERLHRVGSGTYGLDSVPSRAELEVLHEAQDEPGPRVEARSLGRFGPHG